MGIEKGFRETYEKNELSGIKGEREEPRPEVLEKYDSILEDNKIDRADFAKDEISELTDKEAEEENEKLMEEMRNQEIWLKDNAYKYGFIIRYPKQKEEVTGKKYQPFTLRYVGEEVAKKLHDLDVGIDEVDVQSLVE